jgi:hypothetical protein
MFVNGSGRNEYSLQRTFHRCFLLSFTSFGWGVSEEKIKMWIVNGRQTTNERRRQQTTGAKWWQKLTLPLARWANNSHWVDMWLHSDTLFWFQANQSLLFLLNAAFLAEKQQIPILYSFVWQDRDSYPQSIALEASTLTITLPVRFPIFI